MNRRRLNLYEKILLGVGVIIIFIGFFFVDSLLVKTGISWDSLQTLFLLFILVVTIVSTSANENTKEELKIVIQNQAEELKLFRSELGNHIKLHHSRKKR